MNWNMDTRQSKIPEADLPGLQQKAVDLLNHILQAHVVVDNFWLCRVGVRTVSWRNACQMLPVQDAQAALSWREPTGIHGSISHYIPYIQVYTSTY